MDNTRNIWLDGIMGVIVGDALGCPVQFMDRTELKRRGPVTGMEGHGTYNMPEGTWTDDGSMTLALLTSIKDNDAIDLDDIMSRFVAWIRNGEYTPFGEAFDIGMTCYDAVKMYERSGNVYTCGRDGERSNGNGSLMRIMPACLYAYANKLDRDEALKIIHEVSGLTHNHIRSHIGCGFYYFMVCAILDEEGSLAKRLQKGIYDGFAYYEKNDMYRDELSHYERLKSLIRLSGTPEDEIQSSGYVVHSLEASVWSLLRSDNFKDALLTAVNLADDSDTIGAIAGGLAGLYYCYESIPAEWLNVIQRREWIEELCSVNLSEANIPETKNKLTEASLKYIIARLLDNAKDCMIEYKENPKNLFYDGKSLAYYEMLDTVKNELIARDVDLKEYGLDIDLDNMFL